LVAFCSGLALEALAVLWVHCSERNHKVGIVLVSAGQALCQVLGLGSALQGPGEALAFVLGHALGPLIGIALKRRLPAST
jgi:hypothetical protein